jgi:hypothetical protein
MASIDESQRHSCAQNLVDGLYGLYLNEDFSFPPFIFLMHFQSSWAPKFGCVQIRVVIKLQMAYSFFERIKPQISIGFQEVSIEIFVCGTK